jgi:hypothetical protein
MRGTANFSRYMIMKKSILFFLSVMPTISMIVPAQAQGTFGVGQKPETLQSLAVQFPTPDDAYKPHVWWHWLGTNYSKEGMSKDLQAMKASGIGGVVIFNAPSWLDPAKNPWPLQTYRSTAYWDAVKHALTEARKLNMTVGIHNTPGWSNTGGPWVTPEENMQAVTFSKTSVKGGAQRLHITLPNPKGNSDTAQYFKDVALIAVPAGKNDLSVADLLDISANMNAKGELNWQAPKGEWIIYRVGHFPTMSRSHPTPEDVAGYALEADKMNPEAVTKHWNNVLNPFKDRFSEFIGSTFKYIWIDSYEAGDQNWSRNFRADFIRLKGYDPVPQLVLADVRGESVLAQESNGLRSLDDVVAPDTKRFLQDYFDVINRLYMDCWRIGKEMVNKAGFQLCWEPYVSWGGGQFDIEEGIAIADMPVTEFWVHSRAIQEGNALSKAAAANGKRIVGAEAFTGMEVTCKFTETPAMLKRPADMGYNFGANLYFLHSWPHQPFDDKYQPGFSFGHYGTHFSRHQTWFEPGKAFLTYLARCQMLLQQGSFVSRTDNVLHRRTPEADIFFVRNTGEAQTTTIAFPVSNRAPELWDAYAGAITRAGQWKQQGENTAVTLKLEKDASVFVVFPIRKTAYAKRSEITVQQETPTTLEGDWRVAFRPKIGDAPFQKTFSELVDFSKQDDEAVKYFSGTAVYEKKVRINAADLSANKRVVLDLGALHDIAELEVNGKRVGVLWCPPYRTDITPFLKAGDNTLSIAVTNNWTNRLIGDEQYPEDFEWTDKNHGLRAMTALPEWFVKDQPRPVKERKTFVPWYYFTKNSPLYPAGLLGPVKIVKQEVKELKANN